jgi:hypothetical protein
LTFNSNTKRRQKVSFFSDSRENARFYQSEKEKSLRVENGIVFQGENLNAQTHTDTATHFYQQALTYIKGKYFNPLSLDFMAVKHQVENRNFIGYKSGDEKDFITSKW